MSRLWNEDIITEGAEEDQGVSWLNHVGPGYFQTIGTPLLAGRDFVDDTATFVKVAIVNQIFVRKILKSADPLGKRFRIHEPPGKPRPLYQIVGVTGDNKYNDMHEEFLAFMYLPATQQDQIIVRSSLPLAGLMTSVKQAIGSVNPGIAFEFKVFKTQVDNSLVRDELMALLSGFFGFLAALLAALGSQLRAPNSAARMAGRRPELLLRVELLAGIIGK